MKRIVITESQANRLLVQEYFDKPTKILWDYFNMSKEEQDNNLIRNYFWKFQPFLEWEVDEEDYNQIMASSEGQDIEVMIETHDETLAEYIIQGKYGFEIKDAFAYYLRLELKDDGLNSPTWMHLDTPSRITNEWLIHFSDNAFSIASDGFKHATSDIDSLALTTWQPDRFEKGEEGYCFAYDCDDFENYYKIQGKLKYGNEAVIFRASGVKVWHYGDEEYQVIFWGPNAKDFIYVEECEGGWCVRSIKNGNTIYMGESVVDVVNWAQNNMYQYRNHIFDYKGRKNYDNERYYQENPNIKKNNG